MSNREWLALRLQTVSREMLELARAGDWESVRDLEAQRRNLIEDLFRQPLPPDQSPAFENCIRYVLDCDSEVMALGRETMDDLSHQLQTLTQGRRANAVYAKLKD